MSPDEFQYGLDRYRTRLEGDSRLFSINFRNSLIFLVPADRPDDMVPLAWAISAIDEGRANLTRSMNSGNARKRADTAGLERIEVGHKLHDELWQIAKDKVDALTTVNLSQKQRGFSRHHSNPREAAENSFYLLHGSPAEALGSEAFSALPEHEGAGRQITTNRYERKSSLRNACIAHFRAANGGSLFCLSCAFDFEVIYGKIGAGFIHIHHTDPLGNRQEEHLVDPKRDLIPLCPNCHAMSHRKLGSGDKPRSPKKLAALRQSD